MRYATWLLLMLLGFIASPVFAEQAIPVDMARGATADWLDARTDSGLVIVENDMETAFKISAIAGRKSSMMVYQKAGWYLNLGFEGIVEPGTPLKEMRNRLKFVALDRLPNPGLKAPGWEIRPRTPVSSFKKGVEILDYRDDKIAVRVRTEFYALWGRNPSILVPADASAPQGSSFIIKRRFPLDLTLAASVK